MEGVRGEFVITVAGKGNPRDADAFSSRICSAARNGSKPSSVTNPKALNAEKPLSRRARYIRDTQASPG